MRSRALPSLFLALTIGSAPLVAQYPRIKIASVGISLSIPKSMKGLPLRLDSRDPHLRARFRTTDKKKFVKIGSRRFEWFTDVFEFGRAKAPTTLGPKGPGTDSKPKPKPKPKTETEREKLIEELRARAMTKSSYATFEEWMKPQRPSMLTAGKAVKARGTRLAYKLWEYLPGSSGRGNTGYHWYYGAAVYTIDAREVAVLVRMPVKDGKAPKGRVGAMVRRILGSGKLLKDGDADLDDHASKDKYADTPQRKKALEAAKKNIQGMKSWSYFTTRNYIVLYSWDGNRNYTYALAKRLSAGLEKMRKLYMKYYTPEQGMQMPYSVFRVCGTYAQFQKYGSSPRDVVGWFSPASKELVVFQGGKDVKLKKGYLETVTYHEGWHQYSNSFFRGVELHRWFDEGHGDWFGAHAPRGRSFSYIGSGMRWKYVRMMAKKGDYVPFKDIVTWPRRRFYGNPKTSYYYAQAYGLVDFLRKGHTMGKKFDKSWSEILPTYRKVVLEKKSADLATKEAFKDVDFQKMTEAWKLWVLSSRFKKPRK